MDNQKLENAFIISGINACLLPFLILAVVTLFAAVAAMSLRNLVHCALSLTVSLAGLAALYLQLDAQFVGFAQILVYVGAVAILIVFAILLTRSDATPDQRCLAPGWLVGMVVSAVVFATLGWAALNSTGLPKEMPPAPETTVKNIGDPADDPICPATRSHRLAADSGVDWRGHHRHEGRTSKIRWQPARAGSIGKAGADGCSSAGLPRC